MKPIPPRTQERIRQMKAYGSKPAEIARAVGVSKMTVSRILKNSR